MVLGEKTQNWELKNPKILNFEKTPVSNLQSLVFWNQEMVGVFLPGTTYCSFQFYFFEISCIYHLFSLSVVLVFLENNLNFKSILEAQIQLHFELYSTFF